MHLLLDRLQKENVNVDSQTDRHALTKVMSLLNLSG